MQNALSRNVEESLKRVLDPDPRADKFQNLTSSSPTDGAYLCVKFGEDFFECNANNNVTWMSMGTDRPRSLARC